MPAHFSRAAELPDAHYPLVFITGRLLEHWHTGSMTRNASVLNAIEPEAVVCVSPADMRAIGLASEGYVRVDSRRGSITARVRQDPNVQPGTVFMAFCYNEAAANLLTVEELDPFGKIPEFKFCAVRIAPAEAPLRSAAQTDTAAS